MMSEDRNGRWRVRPEIALWVAGVLVALGAAQASLAGKEDSASHAADLADMQRSFTAESTRRESDRAHLMRIEGQLQRIEAQVNAVACDRPNPPRAFCR
jgi:hypothetical protein